MRRIVLVYGSIAGLIVTASLALTLAAGVHSIVIGYLSMLIALSMVFIGVKRYRDEQLGGVIRFSTALIIGLGISLVASLIYAFAWEAYLYATGYRFMPEYIASAIEAKRAGGASAAEIAKMTAEMQDFAKTYSDPAMRLLISISEIAPVALGMTVISAALLRKRDFMPGRTG